MIKKGIISLKTYFVNLINKQNFLNPLKYSKILNHIINKVYENTHLT